MLHAQLCLIYYTTTQEKNSMNSISVIHPANAATVVGEKAHLRMISKEIKSVTLAVLELCLSEGICKSVSK